MSKKKALIITYYWPPSGGGGVQRWMKFVKYLPLYDWEPIVFTPENPEFDLKDTSLSKDVSDDLEVLRFPIWEPFSFYKKFFKKSDGQKLKQGIVIEKAKLSLVDKFTIWVRANLFIPDPRRFWVKPSIDFLAGYIESNGIDVIVTTGPPHSMHLIGLGLKKKCDVQWLADFRDPWSDWDILDKLKVSKIVRSIHNRLERKVLAGADQVITVSNRLAKQLNTKVKGLEVGVLTNGVDDEDFESENELKLPKKFRISHMGLLNEIRDPESLWVALEELCQENPSFQNDLDLVLAGMVSQSILDRLKRSPELSSCLKHLDYISHQEVFGYYKNSSVLLLLLNQTENAKWILPGKLFEYLLANKNILTLGAQESDVQDILKETRAGEVISFGDKERIKSLISSYYEQFLNGSESANIQNTEHYLRRNITKTLSKLLDQMMTKC